MKNQINRKSQLKTKSYLTIHILLCLVCAIFVMATLLCLLAKLLCVIDVPQAYFPAMISTALALTTCVTALIFSKLRGKAGLASGALWGIGLYAVLFFATWTQGRAVLQEASLLRLVGMIIAGSFGGYLGVLWHEKKRRKH